MKDLNKMFTFRKWRLGLLVATLLSLFTAGAGLVAGMGWKPFVAVFCASLVSNWGTYLKQHPIESIEETRTFAKTKVTDPDGGVTGTETTVKTTHTQTEPDKKP